MPGDGDAEGKSDDPKVRLIFEARGASRNVSSGVSASSQARSTAGGHHAAQSSGGGGISTRMSIQARGFEIPDVHQEELRRLEEAIAGGNPETVKVIVARMGSQEGTEVLTRFQEGFVRTRGAKWKTRQMLDHVDMFFAVYDAMEQCLDEEKLIQFVGAVNVRHRFQLLGRAVEKGDNAASSRMMSVFSKQGIDWASDERWRHYRNLLLGAVMSKSCDLFRSMVDILGGTDVVLAHEANTPQPPDVIHWSVRLLHSSCIGGDADMFGLATETFPQVQTASLMRKWRLLDGAVAGGNIHVLKRVVDFMGGEAGLAAPEDYGASGYASQVIDLMRGAIRNHHVVILRKLSEIFPQEAFTADMGSVILLGSAIWTGRLDILRIVIDILGEEALRAAAERGGEPLVRAAVRVHSADILGRVVDVLDEKIVKAITERHGVSLLASAIRSHDDTVVYRVIGFMGEQEVKTAGAKAGAMLLRFAVASGNTSILTQVAEGVGDAALAAAVRGCEVSLLGFAICSADDGVVNLAVDIMGEDAVNVARENRGVSLLRSAIRVHNVKVFDRVAEILGETAVEAAAEQHGESLLKAAIACRDVEVVEHVADKMGDAALKMVAEGGVTPLLRSAVRSENAAVVNRVVEIMGKAAVATVVEKHGVSLLKSAVADSNVAVVNRVMGIMGSKELKDAAEKHGSSLLGSAIRGGDDAFVDRVLKILENQAVKVAIGEAEESRLTSALASGDVKAVEGVVDIVGDVSVKLPPEEDGVALLRSTMAGNKEALVRSVARVLRNANVTITTAGDGVSLFRSAIRSRSIVVMEQVFSLLGDKALGVISTMGGAGFLESAIRSGNVELVDSVVNLLGEEAVTAVGKANGFALLETAFVVGDIALVDFVLGIVGDTVVEIVTGGKGTALLQSALRTRDEVIFERVYVMVKGEVKIAGEDRGKLLISAVESRNVILVNRILDILGNTAAESAIKEEGYRLLESAIWNQYVVSVRSLSDIFGQSATEGGVGTQSSLSAGRMVYSDTTAVVDRVVELMGEKALKNGLKENGPSLLRRATTGGDVTVVERVMNIVGHAAVRSTVEEGDESLLSFAIQSRDMAFLERVVDVLGFDAMSIAAENEGVSLLEDAIWTLDVLTVDRVVDMLGAVEVKSAVEKGGRFLLKSAIESRSVAMVDRVMDILGGEAVENEVQKDGRSLLRSAIQSRDEDTLERVVDVMGVKAVEHAARESGGSLLKSAVQSYDMTFFDRVVDVLGAEAIKVALEKDGGVLLASAIQSRDATFVNRVVNIVGDAAVATAVKEDGASLLKYAVESRDVALVEDVIEIVGSASAAEEDVQSLLGSALAGGDMTAFGRIMDALGDETVSQAVKQAPQKDGGLLVTFAPAPDNGMAFVEGVVDALRNAVVVPKRVVNYIRNGLREIASRSTGGADHFNKVLELLSRQVNRRSSSRSWKRRHEEEQSEGHQTRPYQTQARDKTFAAQLITEKAFLRYSESILELAVKAENLEVVQVAAAWINVGLPQWEAVTACTDALEVAQKAHVVSKEISDRALEILSILLRFGAIPHYDLMAHLMVLSEHYQTKLRTCLMDSVCLAPNPFIPGMNLLVVLSEVSQGVPPSKRKAPEDIRVDLARLLNEVLEQLPKSVDACPGKITTCLSLFEVQTTKKRLPTGFAGPLGVAFRDRMSMEMLCSKPLVLDFMSYRFDVGNSAGGAHNDEGRAIEDRLMLFNSKFYKVPKWRMAFDVEIYILFLYYYTDRVLLYDGDPSISESAFIIYIVGALMIEINELRRDIRGYFQDRWNVLDFLAITLLTAGWFVRMSNNDTLWGRALYALAAPLIFSRALFFAEFLQVQGPMIHVIFGMAVELLQFGIVMLVVMLGFAVSLVALHEDSESSYTYGDACFDLFKAMLGELQLLEEIGDEDQSAAATVLVLVYLIVMTIMLLNLLIAVLSAAHSQVQDRNGLEYIVSKASVIQRYVLVVEHDLLPAPFNLFQVAIGAPFKFVDMFTDRRVGKLYPRAKEHAGMMIFWLFSGPAIIAAGTLKSLLGLRIYEAVKRYRAKQRMAPSWRNKCWLPFSILIATPMMTPTNLSLLWIIGGVLSIVHFFRSFRGKMEAPQVSGPGKVDNMPVKHDVASMLKNSRAGLSLAELQERLEDPMNDPEVRHEEREQATKVEHLKLLRDRLEKTSASEAQALWERIKHMDNRIGGVERTLSIMTDKLDSLGRAISERI